MPGFESKGDPANLNGRPLYTPIKDLFARKGIKFGFATKYGNVNLVTYTPIELAELVRNCNVVADIGDGGMTTTQATEGVWDTSKIQNLCTWAANNGVEVHQGGHLIWHSFIPGWLTAYTTAGPLRAKLQAHIDHLVGGVTNMSSWNVVNETIWVDAGSGNWRQSQFYNAFGANWPGEFFTYARSVSPTAELIWNENHAIEDSAATSFTTLKAALVTALDAGRPITTYGCQMHMSTPSAFASAANMVDRLGQIAALGLNIRITEMDIFDAAADFAYATRRADQVAFVEARLGAIVQQVPRLKSVIMWSDNDSRSWCNVASATRTDTYAREFTCIDRAGWVKKEWHQMFDRITSV